MIILIDNYDSFVYNLARYFQQLGHKTQVFRNDEITIAEIERKKPSQLIISPGPGTPTAAGISLNAIKHFSGKIPLLGVCLGHQAIAQAFACTVERANRPMHGKSRPIYHNNENIFKTAPNPMLAGRYHSLIVSKHNFSEQLKILATSQGNEIMAICHRDHPTIGLQFHPESILTEYGNTLISNFLKL